MVELQMVRQVPFPGESVVLGHEIVRRLPDALWVVAAAVPLAWLNALDADMQAAGLRIDRVDLTILGLWCAWFEQQEAPEAGRSVLLVDGSDGIDLLALEQGVPVMARRLVDGNDQGRLGLELTRSLLSLDMEQGALPLAELCWVGTSPPDPTLREQVKAVADLPLREVPADSMLSPVLGAAWRSAQPGVLNIYPSGWRERGLAQREKRRFVRVAAAVACLWLAVVGVLWGGPYLASQSLSDAQRQIERIQPAYHDVSELRDRVRLIERYTDRRLSLLESLREVSLHMPEGVLLTSLTYRRDDGLRLAGDAGTPEQVYTFKERLDHAPIFEGSTLTGPTWDQRRRRHVFELHAQWREDSE